MSESGPSPSWLKHLLWFVAGAAVASFFWYSNVKNVTNTNQQQNAASFGLQARIQQLQGDLSTCNAKFSRSTVLYDIGMLGGETRAWVIPVDVEPVAYSGKRGDFTHYDPKTQTETVHFQPKAAP